MKFADDTVICSESTEQIEYELETWIYAWERRGVKHIYTPVIYYMKDNRRKTECTCACERVAR